MNPRNMLANLSFIKAVTSRRQTYYMYENDAQYVLMTVNRSKPNAFSLSLVPKEATEYVRRAFKGKTVTVAQVKTQSRKPSYTRTSFDVLSILYALCAIDSAKIDHRFKRKALYFTVRDK